MSNDEHMKTCFTILKMVKRLESLLVMILALVVGFMFFSCNEVMSTWLLVTGFTAPAIFILGLIIFCLALPGFIQASEGGSDESLLISFLPSLICSFIVVLSVIIFNIAWTIYGAVLFFPATTGPYPTCSDGKDGKVLVITGVIIVALKMFFIFFPTIPALTRSRFERTRPDAWAKTNTITWRTRKLNNIEMRDVGNHDTVDDVPQEAVQENKLVAGLHALSLYLMFQ